MSARKVEFEFDRAKAVAVLQLLASRPEAVTHLDKYKAVKLAFLADRYHLVRCGRPIIGGQYRALPFGPVSQEFLELIQERVDQAREETARLVSPDLFELFDVDFQPQYPTLSARSPVESDALSRSDRSALEHVVVMYGQMGFDQLKSLTHATAAYLSAWEGRIEGSRMGIMSYEDFFEENEDAISGAFEEMQENDELRRAFPRL